jgi:hypothetical protein
MAESRAHRLKLHLPNGAEMEAEGTPDFIASERREFAALLAPSKKGGAGESPIEPAWDEIIETGAQGTLALRAKLGGGGTERDACLVLIAASRALLRTPKPTAAQLARWLRASGYPVSRVDRAIQAVLTRGDVLASGSRRARRYALSGPGLAKAFGLGHQLHALIHAPGN